MELKYKEAQRRIIAMVATKDYDVGTKFPDEIELSQKIGFSGITIRRALKELEKTGLISRARGRGTILKRKISKSPNMETLLFIQTYAKTSTNEKMLFPMRQLCAKNGYDFRFIHAEKTDLKTAEEISKAAGVFIIGKVDKDWINFITGLGKSYVVIGDPQYQDSNTMAISYDWFAGVYGITERLIYKGCKRIIYCSSPDSYAPASAMIKGYREAVVNGKIPYEPDIVLRINKGEYGKVIKPVLLKEKFDGIICNNDCYPFLISLLYNMDFDRAKIKIGLLDTAWEHHLHEIPMIDDLTMAYYPSVLTISSVKILLKKIADSSMKNRRFLIKPKFIEN